MKNMGIYKYKTGCHMCCAGDWNTTTARLCRSIGAIFFFYLFKGKLQQFFNSYFNILEFENGYKTLDPSYMKSVWRVFKQLYEKELVLRRVKILLYSTKCCTPLSHFEEAQNVKITPDPSGNSNFTSSSETALFTLITFLFYQLLSVFH